MTIDEFFKCIIFSKKFRKLQKYNSQSNQKIYMKNKKISKIIVAIIFATSFSATAQTDTVTKTNTNTNTSKIENPFNPLNWIFGIRYGFNFDQNYSNFEQNPLYYFNLDFWESRPLMGGGFFAEINISQKLSLRPEYASGNKIFKINPPDFDIWNEWATSSFRLGFLYNFRSSAKDTEIAIPYLSISPGILRYWQFDIDSIITLGDRYLANEEGKTALDFSFGGGVKFPIKISQRYKFYLGAECLYYIGALSSRGIELTGTLAFPLRKDRPERPKPIEIITPEPPPVEREIIVIRDTIIQEREVVRVDTVRVVYVEKPCYEVSEILAYIENGYDVHNKKICLHNIHFAHDEATIEPISFSAIDNMVALMNRMPNLILKINGHTDNVGDARYNEDLSLRRARAVYNYMISKGILVSRLSYAGFGLTRPIDSNDTEEGRRQNRRVEFEIIGY